jgi:hypothetical protein
MKDRISATANVTPKDSSSPRQSRYVEKLIGHINRKNWWHVPPTDPRAYEKRGKFLASSFRQAEFYGRPCDAPERVGIASPLVGDNDAIERTLIGRVESDPNMSVPRRLALDVKLRRAALRKGFDSIVLLTPKGFEALRQKGVTPRSIELNVIDLRCLRIAKKSEGKPDLGAIPHKSDLAKSCIVLILSI